MPRHPLTNAFIALFLLFQLAVPLTYYVRADPYDERFAWRMFSGTRLQTCETRAYRLDDDDNEMRIDLKKTIHAAWITMMKRNRPAAMRAFIERECRAGESKRVRLEVHCTDVDDTPLPVREISLDCTTGTWADAAETGAP